MSVEAHTGGADEATLYGWVDLTEMERLMKMNLKN